MNTPLGSAAPAVADGGDHGTTTADLGPQAPEVGGAGKVVPQVTLGQTRNVRGSVTDVLNVSDVLYLTDMDSEALCLHQLHQVKPTVALKP